MAKKERKDEIVFSPSNESITEEEKPMYETEAYGSPKPEAGSDVTVMKQVGIGGPVPIVAPKHNTIQLQPIVVPLAVVPYMTQDSNVLRTDGKQQAPYGEEEYDEATQFESVSAKKKKSANKYAKTSRIFSLVTLLISLIIEVPFILSYFGIKIGEDIQYLNVIGMLEGWINSGTIENMVACLIYLGIFVCTGLSAIISLFTLMVGKYPRGILGFFNFCSFAGIIALMIMLILQKQFVPADTKIFVALIAVTALNFVLTIVLSIVLNKIEDEKEKTISREI